MPRIKTPKGYIKYTTIPLYEGVKVIDKVKAEENLHILMPVLEKYGIKTQLAFGSLLGAMREHDFITHDEDIDLNILEEEKDQFFCALHELMDLGFKIARYDRRGLLSIIRNGEYIDFYVFSPYTDNLRYCSGMIIPKNFLEDLKPMVFKGETFYVPRETEEYLIFEYGQNWMTPVQWNNYDMPWWSKLLFCIKEKVKGVLPGFLYFRMVKGAEKQLRARYQRNIDRYNTYKKTNR